MKRIACIGEAMIELSMDGDQAHLGCGRRHAQYSNLSQAQLAGRSGRLCDLSRAGYVVKAHCGIYCGQ